MPRASMRSDAEFAFPERVLGPVQEHRRILSSGGWRDDVFEGGAPPIPMGRRTSGAFMPPPPRMGRMTPPPMGPSPYVDEYDFDYNYDYDMEDEFMGPPPMMARGGPRGPMMRGPPPMMGARGGYFKPMAFEETRFRTTPPPPGLMDDMTRLRRSPVPSPIFEETTVLRGSPPPPPVGMIGRRGMDMRGFAAAAMTTVVGERALAAEVISEEVTIRPIGYEVWEEKIETPIVTPIMQTVVRQDPIMVEKRITQEVGAPMVVQEQGAAAATTVVESGTMAPTIVQEMGMTAPPTVVQEGYVGAAAATVSTGFAEPRLVNEWETRPPTVVREMDATLPPVPGGVGFQQGPIVVNEQSTGMGVGGVTTTTMTSSMRPPINVSEPPIVVPPQGGYNNNTFGGASTFEQGMGMPGGIGAPPVPGNMGPPPAGMNANAFGGPADLNNLGEPRARGLKRLRQKMHRHH